MKLALAQIDIVWENKIENRLKCEKFIIEAKELKMDLVIFPEMSLTGFSMNVDKIGDENDETIEWFKGKAKQYDLNIGFGYVEKGIALGENKYMIVDSKGNSLIEYSKIHPFSYAMEDKYYKSGKNICITNIKNINVSTFICYDLRFPEIFQIASKKADLIIVAANWPKSRKEHWISLIKARAIENQCYIAGVNRVGHGEGIFYSGNSMVVSPSGKVLVECINEEKLIICEVNANEVANVREKFPMKKDRKEKLYLDLLQWKENIICE